MQEQFNLANVLALAVALGAWGCTKKTVQPGPPPVPEVLVTEVVKGEVPVVREWVGTLDGSDNADIRARVTGYLQKRAYQEGSYVKQGDLLFEIDPRPFEATLAEAKSQLAQQQAIELASQADFARAQDLYNKKVISQQEYENKRQLNQANVAKTAALQAAVESAQLNLGYTKVTAPVDGIAGLAKAQIGDLVGTGSETTLTTVSKIDPIRLYFPIGENDYKEHANTLRQAMAKPASEREALIKMVFADGSVYPQKGTFSFVDRQVDPTTGTILIAANFPNPDHTLRPGQFAKARVAIEKLQGALLVPEIALWDLQGAYQIGVLRADGKADIRPIKIGPRFNRQVVVTDGLSEGEKVIVEGVQKVRPGMTVTAKPYQEAAKANSAQAQGPDRGRPTAAGWSLS